MNRLFKFAVLILPLFATVIISSATVHAAPTHVSMVVNPHLDDEMQVWSLVENSSSNYKVFVYLTRGEQTGYCVNSTYNTAFRPDLGETQPVYTPQGKWTDRCVESRINSTLNFLNNMGSIDSTIPSGFTRYGYSTVSLPSNGVSISRDDNGTLLVDTTARVYNSTNGMGNAVVFNLGDGDLTQAEVDWAIRAVKNNPSLFGIPAGIPFYNALGAFANSKYPNCNVYSHADHKSIHTALYNTDYGFTGYQTAATCATDPDVARTKDVSYASWDAAWRIGANNQRIGFAQKNYGWLDSRESGWGVGYGTQQNSATPFMQRQSFWQRF